MAQKKTKSIQTENQPKQDSGFPIVGLGASAVGLEAFELFFHNIPADSGMGFVLVLHLDPSHASVLTEILQRITTMPDTVIPAGMTGRGCSTDTCV
jgi:two-component system CheB/CheR fusion protein